MINAPYEKEFVFNNGQRAKNLLELSVIVERMNQQDFEIFVNPSKNDFANWIEYVLSDKQLASSLRSTILLNTTRELLSSKLAAENASNSSITAVDNKYKKTLFNIFKHEPKNTVVQIHVPIEKIPESENRVGSEHAENQLEAGHHIIQKIPDLKSPEKKATNTSVDKTNKFKKRWFAKKNIQEQPEQKNDLDNNSRTFVKPEDDIPKNSPKKDNALKRWYEFKKKESELRKHETHKSNDSENSSEDSSSGNILWILIYGLLIVLIIALIVYKFVLRI